jgi:hypothetical protein
MVNRLLHAPTRRLRAAADGARDRYAEMVRDLFGLYDDAAAEVPQPSVSGPPPGTRAPARSSLLIEPAHSPARARTSSPPGAGGELSVARSAAIALAPRTAGTCD